VCTNGNRKECHDLTLSDLTFSPTFLCMASLLARGMSSSSPGAACGLTCGEASPSCMRPVGPFGLSSSAVRLALEPGVSLFIGSRLASFSCCSWLIDFGRLGLAWADTHSLTRPVCISDERGSFGRERGAPTACMESQ
jgi:hypothetical protein